MSHVAIPLQPKLFRAIERFVNLSKIVEVTAVNKILEEAFFRGTTFGDGYEEIEEFRNLAEKLKREAPHQIRFAGDPPPFKFDVDRRSTVDDYRRTQLRARRWLREFVDHGKASNELYQRVIDSANDIGSEFEVRFNGVRYSVDFDYQFEDLESIALFVVGQIIEHGLAAKVRVCVAPGCGNIILDVSERGRRERRWCLNNACGSRIRVAAKRAEMSTSQYLRKLARGRPNR